MADPFEQDLQALFDQPAALADADEFADKVLIRMQQRFRWTVLAVLGGCAVGAFATFGLTSSLTATTAASLAGLFSEPALVMKDAPGIAFGAMTVIVALAAIGGYRASRA